MIRLVSDQSAQITRTEKVEFTFDGEAIWGYAGESLAAALIRSRRLHLRDAPEDAGPRGAFCLMGLCQECVVVLEGQPIESCRIELQPGIAVTSLRHGADD
jgi:aerobic-type carbon monoxide dehydrogenase small subunit (CoxS/CutS family)